MTHCVLAFARFRLAPTSLALAGLICASPALLHAQGLKPAVPRPAASSGTPSIASPSASVGGADAGKSADFIVAVVNSEPITNGEVRVESQRIAQQLAQARRPQPPPAEMTRLVLERMISEKAQLQWAREIGVRVDDAGVDQAEQSVAAQNKIDGAELRRRLAADGITVVKFREQLRDQLTLTRLREREVDSRVRVSDLEVNQYLKDQPAGGDSSKRELNLAQILVAVPEAATPEQVTVLQAKAQSALTRATAGEDFAVLARELSDSPERANGGQLGLRPEDRYPPLFLDATQSLAVGGLSALVRSGAGFHVLKVLEKGAAGTSVVQSRARHILLRASPQLSETQARDKLAEFKTRIQAGQADFASLARDNSQDGSAALGGDLGWASPGQFVPEFEAAMNALAPGQVSTPLISRFGVHLIQLMERRTAALTPRQQQEVTRNLLREKKLDEAYATWAQDLRARAYVEMREPPQP